MWDWIVLLAVGAVVGALGRLLHPGRDWINLLGTLAIGIGSLGIAQAIFSSFWVALVVGVLVAAVLLTAYAWYVRAQTELPEA
jgi:uncharacterized membrane protein YeaQ/YmgE (transglycosylase-associated protein family)